MTIPKTLLVTGSTPGDRDVGEIILRDLCALLPADKLCVFLAGHLAPQESPYATEIFLPPNEQAWRPLASRLGGLMNYASVLSSFNKQIGALIGCAVEYGRKQEVEQVWLVLNSVSLIASGDMISRKLGVPLRTLVWDPFEYLCQQNDWDTYSRVWLEKRFACALGASEKVMVVSDGMVEQYGAKYGAKCVIVRHALKQKPGPAGETIGADKGHLLRIGFAGTLYDHSQLNVLLHALHTLDWEIAGRRIVLRMIGNSFRLKGIGYPCNIELLGWRSTDETYRLLKECALQYLPISFHGYWKEFSQLSFPTKLSTYLATGRPVLVHGPADCSSGQFCDKTQIGIHCTSLNPDEMAAALQKLLSDSAFYASASRSVVRTCKEHFSPEVMRSQFLAYMDCSQAAEST